MRLVRILVRYEDQYKLTSVLEAKNVDFVLTPAEIPQNYCLVEFPLPVGAVEDILNEVRDRGIDVGKYTVVTSLETATTQNLADLEEEYVGDSSDIKRISHAELRVEAQEHKPPSGRSSSSPR